MCNVFVSVCNNSEMSAFESNILTYKYVIKMKITIKLSFSQFRFHRSMLFNIRKLNIIDVQKRISGSEAVEYNIPLAYNPITLITSAFNVSMS